MDAAINVYYKVRVWYCTLHSRTECGGKSQLLTHFPMKNLKSPEDFKAWREPPRTCSSEQEKGSAKLLQRAMLMLF